MAQDTEFVTPAVPAPPQTIRLTPVDQLMVGSYINLILCFPLSTSTNIQETYAKMKSGLTPTLSEIPFVGGVVVPEEGGRGRHQINIDQGYGMRFVFRNFATTSTFKCSYEELQRAKFPNSAMDAEKLSPFGYIPTSATPAVMAAQANFFTGGMLLTVSILHTASDVLGLAEILKCWVKNIKDADAANGISPQAPVPPARSMDRATMMKGHSGADIKDFPEYRLLEGQKETLQQRLGVVEAAPPTEFSTFYFSPAHLAQLKRAASSPNPDDPWISTNDALCAFIWHHTSLARRLLSSPHSTSRPLMFAMAVEGRRRLSPPLQPSYLGNATFFCPITAPVSSVVSPSSLYALAFQFRTAITRFDNARMRDIIGLIDGMPVVSDLKVTCYDDPGRGLWMTSWADMGLYELEWGEGMGVPECVRIPELPTEGGTFPGAGAIFPRLPDGGLEAILGLEVETMERSRADEAWGTFAEWVCS